MQITSRKMIVTAMLLLATGGYAHAAIAPADTTSASKPMARMQMTQANSVDDVKLQGVVTDTDNLPLPGVHVIIRETKQAVVSDFDGVFTIALPKGKVSTVDFSFVGMKTETKVYDGKKNYVGQVIKL